MDSLKKGLLRWQLFQMRFCSFTCCALLGSMFVEDRPTARGRMWPLASQESASAEAQRSTPARMKNGACVRASGNPGEPGRARPARSTVDADPNHTSRVVRYTARAGGVRQRAPGDAARPRRAGVRHTRATLKTPARCLPLRPSAGRPTVELSLAGCLATVCTNDPIVFSNSSLIRAL